MAPTAFKQIDAVPKTYHKNRRAVRSDKVDAKVTKRKVVETKAKIGEQKQRKALTEAEKRRAEIKAKKE